MSGKLIFPKNYSSHLTLRQTQWGIKIVKDNFQKYLAIALNLFRVSAPMFVTKASGLNDNLNGVERPVSFDIPELGDETVEERGASVALVMVKRFAGGVFRGLRGSGEVRRSIACAADWREVRGILETCAPCFEYRERGVEMYGREAE